MNIKIEKKCASTISIFRTEFDITYSDIFKYYSLFENGVFMNTYSNKKDIEKIINDRIKYIELNEDY